MQRINKSPGTVWNIDERENSTGSLKVISSLEPGNRSGRCAVRVPALLQGSVTVGPHHFRFHMDVSLFVQGILIGLTLAVPVGPLALMCIQRAVTEGRLHGIISGVGVATADSLYAAVAFLGLTVVSGLIIAQQYLFRFLAGVVLILIGIRVFLSVPSSVSAKTEHETYLKDYLSTFALAIANPLTLIFFLVILPGYGVVIQGTSFVSAAEFVAGVFFGSTVWWVVLCGSLGSVRSRISTANLGLINRVSGLLISCFGAGMLILLIITMRMTG